MRTTISLRRIAEDVLEIEVDALVTKFKNRKIIFPGMEVPRRVEASMEVSLIVLAQYLDERRNRAIMTDREQFETMERPVVKLQDKTPMN